MERVSPCRRPRSSIGFDAPTAMRIVNTKTKTRRKEKAFMLIALFVGKGVVDSIGLSSKTSLDFKSCHISHQASKAKADQDLFGYDWGNYLNRFRRHSANSIDCGLQTILRG